MLINKKCKDCFHYGEDKCCHKNPPMGLESRKETRGDVRQVEWITKTGWPPVPEDGWCALFYPKDHEDVAICKNCEKWRGTLWSRQGMCSRYMRDTNCDYGCVLFNKRKPEEGDGHKSIFGDD